MQHLRTPSSKSLATLAGLLVMVLFLGGVAAGQVAGSGEGIANRAVGRLANLNLNGPGYLYYGVNGADRGLGYIGSYMTLGGFVPLAEDDLGGVWNADLRSHLSVNGGFFSNVGAVRKQLLGGGSLLGFGIFWDYDGDLNQYPTFGEPAAIFGQFGHVYNQVGVSGELLTDWGNLRSNGYIPVGQTGFQFLNDHTPFIQNYIIAQNGLDAALGGADLELGAYVPALADWAGMINVGGYAFGNARYTQNYGPDAGADLVPWFGGVYTRLDLTLADNWDFSIRYNNDSFFDSTGYVRLTYRMGGSRRRNVPDQMEQPMVRNEHIVRAHETPLVALNPQNGNQPWQVVHVDSSAFPNGDGTAEAPFQTLAEAQASAIVSGQPWAITYVKPGLSSLTGGVLIDPYTDSFTFQRPNQFLIGSGGPLTIGTQPLNGSSLLTVPALTSTNPVLSNTNAADANGASIVIAGGNGGATIANLTTVGSIFGLDATGNLSGTPQPTGTTANPFGLLLASAGASSTRNVSFQGSGSAANQTGIQMINASGGLEATDTAIDNMTVQGIQIEQGDADVDYFGRITTNTNSNGGVSAGNILIDINNTTGGTINLAASAAPGTPQIANQILDVGAEGILIEGNSEDTTINIANATLINNIDSAIFLQNDFSTTTINTVARTDVDPTYTSGIMKNTDGAAIALSGGAPQFTFNGTINNSPPATGTRQILAMQNLDGSLRTAGTARIMISGPGIGPLKDSGDGVRIDNVNNYDIVQIDGLELTGTSANGILLENSNNSEFAFNNTTITGSADEAVLLRGLGGTSNVTFTSLDVALNNAGAVGIAYQNSSNTGLVQFTDTSITGATSQGVLLNNNTGTTAFENLEINLASTTAQAFNATNAGTVYTTGTNTIANASATLAAIYIEQTTDLTGPSGEGLDFFSVSSGNTQGRGQIVGLTLLTPGAGYAASTTVPVDANSPSTVGGIMATADATTDAAGTVTSIAVTNAGTGYTTGDTVSLPPSASTVSVTTAATASVSATTDPTEPAITIVGGGATGEINMGTFTVGGANGTGLNVNNTGGVTVNVGGTQISP